MLLTTSRGFKFKSVFPSKSRQKRTTWGKRCLYGRFTLVLIEDNVDIIKEGKMTFMTSALLLVGNEIDGYLYLNLSCSRSCSLSHYHHLRKNVGWRRPLVAQFLLHFLAPGHVWLDLEKKKKAALSGLDIFVCVEAHAMEQYVLLSSVLFLFGSLLLILETYRKTYKSKCWDTPAMRNWAEFQLSVTTALAKKRFCSLLWFCWFFCYFNLPQPQNLILTLSA